MNAFIVKIKLSLVKNIMAVLLSIKITENETFSRTFDQSSTISDVKNHIDTHYFLDPSIFYLRMKSRIPQDHEVLEDVCSTQNDEDVCHTPHEAEVCLRILGGTRYKKSSSAMRWKWMLKRTRRLQRKRRKMRKRAQ